MRTYFDVGGEFIVEGSRDPGSIDRYIHAQFLLDGLKTGRFESEEDIELNCGFTEMLERVESAAFDDPNRLSTLKNEYDSLVEKYARQPTDRQLATQIASLELLIAMHAQQIESRRQQSEYQQIYHRELPKGIQEARGVDLELRSKEVKYNIHQFHPAGALELVDAGHNGYTWVGKRQYFTLAPKNHAINHLENTLISSPRIGSGSGVNVSVLPVVAVESVKTMALEKSLPSILIWSEGCFHGATYDPVSSHFKPKEGGVRADSRQLMLASTPTVFCDYLKDFRPKVPNVTVPLIIREGPHFAERAFHRIIGHWSNRDYSEYLINQLTPRSPWRWTFLRRRLLKDPSEEDLSKYCHATLAEVRGAIDAGINDNGELNRFLLYKAFEKSREPGCSYLVGQITGDSWTIHLPYARVERIQVLEQRKTGDKAA